MGSKSIFIWIFAVTLLLSCVSGAWAIGITPGRTTIDFGQDNHKTITVKVINSDHKDLNLKVIVRGDLNQSISLNGNTFAMKSTEEEKELTFDFNPPADISPGAHMAEVVVVEDVQVSQNGKASVGASLGVATQVALFVPYPGKYLEGELNVAGDESSKKFIIALNSRGQDAIQSAKAEIVIYDAQGNEVNRTTTDEISLAAGESKEITGEWKVDKPTGQYTAKAVLTYDGKQVLLQKDFQVGEKILDLQRIYVDGFKLGDIAKFNMVVQNKWNEPINGAYAEMRVFDNAMSQIADFKSATYDIPQGVQTTMNYYWDTKDVSAGTYNANVILYYNNQKTQQDMKLDVAQNSITVMGLGYVVSSDNTSSGGSNIVMILSVIIGFLVLLNVLWFVLLRKRVKK